MAHALSQIAAIGAFLVGGSVAFGVLADTLANHSQRIGDALAGRSI